MQQVRVFNFSSRGSVHPSVLRAALGWALVVCVSIFLARASSHLGLSLVAKDLAEAIVAVGTLVFGSYLGWNHRWLEMVGVSFIGCFGFFLAVVAGEMVLHGPITGFFLGVLLGIIEGMVMYLVFLALLGLGGIAGLGGRMVLHRD